MTAGRWDAIVIGADVNGLVAAQYLARGGRRVLVIGQRDAADAYPDVGWVPPKMIRELGLQHNGLSISQPDPWITAPLAGGGRLELWRDVAKSADAIRRISPADAAKWPEFCTRMRRLAGVLEALYVQPAPDVETRELGEMLRLARLGLRVRRLGKQVIIDNRGGAAGNIGMGQVARATPVTRPLRVTTAASPERPSTPGIDWSTCVTFERRGRNTPAGHPT